MSKISTLAAIVLTLTCASAGPLRADEAPVVARTLLTSAQSQAKTQKKRVLVMFHATW